MPRSIPTCPPAPPAHKRETATPRAAKPARVMREGGTMKGEIAVVADATRGAGRGIARMLGEAGATVYCTGRSSRTQPNTSDHHYACRPETIEETAEMVTAAGGEGIPVHVDHNVPSEVAALVARVRRERKRL